MSDDVLKSLKKEVALYTSDAKLLKRIDEDLKNMVAPIRSAIFECFGEHELMEMLTHLILHKLCPVYTKSVNEIRNEIERGAELSRAMAGHVIEGMGNLNSDK